MFDSSTFKKYLQTQWLGQDFHHFEELESTNSYLKKLPAEEISHGMVCLADHQTKGRGQYERNWESEPGQNLTFTLVFTPSGHQRLHVLTLTLAYSLVELINRDFKLSAQIKWPNDILIGGRKLGGLLTETVFTGNSLDRVLVGIGLNINQVTFSGDVRDKATSLRLESGSEINRERFLADFLQFAEPNYARWNAMSRDLVRSINRRIIGYGDWVEVEVNGEPMKEQQKLVGINEEGKLIVIDKEAEVQTFAYEQIRITSR